MRKLAWVLLGLAITVPACGTAEKGKGGKVLATVNGEAITDSMLEEEAKTLPPYVRPIMETPAGRMQFLDSLITRDLLVREALRRSLDRKDDVKERLSMARRSILLEAVLRDVAEKAPGLSDEALRKYYEANRQEYQVGERVKVSHILFPDRAQAEGALRRAKSGEPFGALMKAAAAAGGNAADLGFIEKGKFVKEFEEAAFKAPQGEPIGPVKTQYGFHVILVAEKRPAGLQPFEEVKAAIMADQKERVQREAFETLVGDLKKRAKIKILAEPAGAQAPAAGGATPNPAPGGKAEGAVKGKEPAGATAPGGK